MKLYVIIIVRYSVIYYHEINNIFPPVEIPISVGGECIAIERENESESEEGA